MRHPHVFDLLNNGKPHDPVCTDSRIKTTNLSLPETNSSHLNHGSWETTFLFGCPIFRGKRAVGFREGQLVSRTASKQTPQLYVPPKRLPGNAEIADSLLQQSQWGGNSASKGPESTAPKNSSPPETRTTNTKIENNSTKIEEFRGGRGFLSI